MYSRSRTYYVYIMTNRSKTLYTGITSNLPKRVWQHKTSAFPGFTSRYKLDRLVYYERFASVGAAIQREKQIKGLLRIKKMALIVSINPEWKDLSGGWYDQYRPDRCPEKCIDPSPSASRREASDSG
jgi:putative endonuclease